MRRTKSGLRKHLTLGGLPVISAGEPVVAN